MKVGQALACLDPLLTTYINRHIIKGMGVSLVINWKFNVYMNRAIDACFDIYIHITCRRVTLQTSQKSISTDIIEVAR